MLDSQAGREDGKARKDMDRLENIKKKIDRAKTYGLEPNVTLADIEWLIGQAEGWHQEVLLREQKIKDSWPKERYPGT